MKKNVTRFINPYHTVGLPIENINSKSVKYLSFYGNIGSGRNQEICSNLITVIKRICLTTDFSKTMVEAD